ncbi:MAG: DUF3576 domain-containing protein [Holosporales bacterium]|jgi:hypothetical protein|nr:DUF3576 domain-containing protein [Holosporales bacterium]
MYIYVLSVSNVIRLIGCVRRLLVPTVVGLLVAACSTLDRVPPHDKSIERRHNFGSISGTKGIVFNLGTHPSPKDETTTTCAVNKFLWQGALDTIGFMPISYARPDKGRIATNWYVDPNLKDIRVRVTIQIFGETLRADAIKVFVERQRLERGTWTDYRLSAQECTKLELLIVKKARKLFKGINN